VTVTPWVTLGCVRDYLHGAESDSGYFMPVPCPKCGEEHLVTLSVIGRFMFDCRGALVSGNVENWKRAAVLVEKEGGKA
jgi:hypothetical protein